MNQNQDLNSDLGLVLERSSGSKYVPDSDPSLTSQPSNTPIAPPAVPSIVPTIPAIYWNHKLQLLDVQLLTNYNGIYEYMGLGQPMRTTLGATGVPGQPPGRSVRGSIENQISILRRIGIPEGVITLFNNHTKATGAIEATNTGINKDTNTSTSTSASKCAIGSSNSSANSSGSSSSTNGSGSSSLIHVVKELALKATIAHLSLLQSTFVPSVSGVAEHCQYIKYYIYISVYVIVYTSVI